MKQNLGRLLIALIIAVSIGTVCHSIYQEYVFHRNLSNMHRSYGPVLDQIPDDTYKKIP